MFNSLTSIPKDKWMHFGVSACISLSARCLLSIVLPYWYAVLFAIALTAWMGTVKEIIDKISGKGTPDINDFWADVIGALAGAL